MCCQAEWKREAVPDHKFDFINVREFHSDSFGTRMKYIWKYILILKNFAIYGVDIFTATTMILSDHWTNAIQRKCGDDCAIDVQFKVAKWVFVGCIIFSFVLLAYESYKAKKVVESRDISYAFTNLIANDYYSVKSYDIFCLFCRINSSTKKADDFAFFIYFTFKDWKRLLLADGPRQSINALTLYSFAYANGFNWGDLPSWWDESVSTAMLLFAICFTVIVFLGSLILLIAASVLYIPLLCYIQGNLKEYVCHKVDKRISELIHKNRRDRIRRNAALEKKMANGSIKDAPGIIPQPTLPSISLDDEDVRGRRKLDGELRRAGQGSGGGMPARGKKEYETYEAYSSAGLGYPPTLDYAPSGVGSQVYEYEQYGSSANLAASAAPMGISYPQIQPPRPAATPLPNQTGNSLYNTSSSSQQSLYAGAQPSFQPSHAQQPQPQRADSRAQYSQPAGEYGYAHSYSYEYGLDRAAGGRSVSPAPSGGSGYYDGGLVYDRGSGGAAGGAGGYGNGGNGGYGGAQGSAGQAYARGQGQGQGPGGWR